MSRRSAGIPLELADLAGIVVTAEASRFWAVSNDFVSSSNGFTASIKARANCGAGVSNEIDFDRLTSLRLTHSIRKPRLRFLLARPTLSQLATQYVTENSRRNIASVEHDILREAPQQLLHEICGIRQIGTLERLCRGCVPGKSNVVHRCERIRERPFGLSDEIVQVRGLG